MKKKIYIAGCGGMLGEGFHHVFKDEYELKCTDKDVNEDWLTYLDFRDFEAYKKDVFEFKPDYLFHLGAHKCRAFAGLDMLKLDDLHDLTIHFKGNAVPEIACCKHK